MPQASISMLWIAPGALPRPLYAGGHRDYARFRIQGLGFRIMKLGLGLWVYLNQCTTLYFCATSSQAGYPEKGGDEGGEGGGRRSPNNGFVNGELHWSLEAFRVQGTGSRVWSLSFQV